MQSDVQTVKREWSVYLTISLADMLAQKLRAWLLKQENKLMLEVFCPTEDDRQGLEYLRPIAGVPITPVERHEDAQAVFHSVLKQDAADSLLQLCLVDARRDGSRADDNLLRGILYTDPTVRHVFPWHEEQVVPMPPKMHVFTHLLQYLDPEPDREGLKDTPARAQKAWEFWTSGYSQDPAAVLKVFEDGADNYDQMVTVKDIPLYSHCEHHLAPIFGTCTISYIPNGRIVGLSKLSRLVEVFARRLQVQERLTSQIADALNEHLKPAGVGVVIKARHMCMESRGICQQGHHTITSALRGAMRDEPETRNEFLRMAIG